jgi:hypothetical protein
MSRLVSEQGAEIARLTAAIAALVAERDALLPDAQAWRNAVAMVEQAKADGYSFTSVGIPDDAARAAQEPRT